MGRGLILVLAALTTPAIAAAEPEASTAATGATPKKADNREFPGLPIGTFVALPQVVLSATRDDNIYAQRTDETEDTVYTLSPSLLLQSEWERHELSVDLGADIDRYQDQGSEDVEDWWFGLDGTYELTDHTRIFGGLRHTRDHEDRFVPGSVLHPEGSDRALTIASAAPVEDGPGWRLRFAEVADRTAAAITAMRRGLIR